MMARFPFREGIAMRSGLTLGMALLTAGLIWPMETFRCARGEQPPARATDRVFAPDEFELFYPTQPAAPRLGMVAVRGIKVGFPEPYPPLKLPRIAHHGLVDFADGPGDPPEMLIEQMLGALPWAHAHDHTVTLVLRGVEDESTRQAVDGLLPSLVDDPQSWLISRQPSRPDRVRLAPVARPEALATKIRFGKVTRIEGRTIFVRVDAGKARCQAFALRAWDLASDLTSRVGLLVLIARLKLLAWWDEDIEAEALSSSLQGFFWSSFESAAINRP
ncbi:MAG TPA: hypothetical protein VG013_23740 [Gemmataceae bacterium]|jgi:hypothetical protein|nr:hypothetical protein [Gemmataceae bacterium]